MELNERRSNVWFRIGISVVGGNCPSCHSVINHNHWIFLPSDCFFPLLLLIQGWITSWNEIFKTNSYSIYVITGRIWIFEEMAKINKINKICYISCCSFVWPTTSDLRISYDNFAFVLVKPSGYWISCEAASISFARSWTSQTSSYLLASYCCSNFWAPYLYCRESVYLESNKSLS